MPAPSGVPTVVHVAHTTERGGAELALARLLASPCREWDARLLLPPSADPGAFRGLDPERVEIVRAGAPQRAGASRATPWAAARFAAALVRQAVAVRRSGGLRGADVVHANSTRAAVYAALALLGTSTPLVVHLRDRVERAAMGAPGLLAFRLLAARRAAGFIANSASTAETIRPLLRRDQFVETIPSPIGVPVVERPNPPVVEPRSLSGATRRRDAEAESRGLEAAPDSTPEARAPRVRIGMVARLDPWKGQEELIRAYALAGVDDRATLVLVGAAAFGHDEFEGRLRALVGELGLRHVSFAGHRDDVADRIDALDVCVQYSTRPEPLGQNVLQYLARGRAVVAAAEGGPAEWIRDGVNGLLVPPRDIPALAATLRQLADDPALRDSLGAAASATEGLSDDCAVTRAHGRVFARAAAGRH